MSYQLGPLSITGSVISTTGSFDVVNGNLGLQYQFVDLSDNYFIENNSPAVAYRVANTNDSSPYDVWLPDATTCPNRVYMISRGSDATPGTINIRSVSNIEDKNGGVSTSTGISNTQRYHWISDGSSWILVMAYV